MLAFVSPPPSLSDCQEIYSSYVAGRVCDYSSLHVSIFPVLQVRLSIRARMFLHQARLSSILTQLQRLPCSHPLYLGLYSGFSHETSFFFTSR